MSLDILKKKILILCGSGGVGKTSVAASLAILAANRGKRVLVLTIDPSKRLAQTLGMDPLSEEQRKIPKSLWVLPGNTGEGHLSGMILNPKKTFDDVIRRFAKTPETAEEILRNPIYQHLSSILAGSQDYMAMEKLLEVSETHHDLIILDTPPSHHVLDFLEAPQKMVRAVSDSLLKYFLKPGLVLGHTGFKLLKKGPKAIFSVLDRIAGVSFLEEVSEMLILAQGLLEGFKKRASDVEGLLEAEQTGFLMVTTPSPWAVRDAALFYESLSHKRVDLCGLFLNRVTPHFDWTLSRDEERTLPKETVQAGKAAYAFYTMLNRREAREREELAQALGHLPMWTIPLLAEEVHDLETLKLMAMQLAE